MAFYYVAITDSRFSDSGYEKVVFNLDKNRTEYPDSLVEQPRIMSSVAEGPFEKVIDFGYRFFGRNGTYKTPEEIQKQITQLGLNPPEIARVNKAYEEATGKAAPKVDLLGGVGGKAAHAGDAPKLESLMMAGVCRQCRAQRPRNGV